MSTTVHPFGKRQLNWLVPKFVAVASPGTPFQCDWRTPNRDTPLGAAPPQRRSLRRGRAQCDVARPPSDTCDDHLAARESTGERLVLNPGAFVGDSELKVVLHPERSLLATAHFVLRRRELGQNPLA